MKIAVLGSTGSIGCNTLQVAREMGYVDVVALTAGRNVELLAEQQEAVLPVTGGQHRLWDACRPEKEEPEEEVIFYRHGSKLP